MWARHAIANCASDDDLYVTSCFSIVANMSRIGSGDRFKGVNLSSFLDLIAVGILNLRRGLLQVVMHDG